MAAMTNATPLRLLRVVADKQVYALEESAVLSINPASSLKRNKAPGNPLGWLPDETPVYSLDGLLHRREESAFSNGALLEMQGMTPWALAVDRVGGEIEVFSDQISALPRIARNSCHSCIQGALVTDSEIVYVISPQHLHPSAIAPAEEPERWQPPKAEASELESGDKVRHILAFKLYNEDPPDINVLFALSLSQVIEILGPTDITPLPYSPPGILGMINWRNRAIPVVDLGRKVALPPLLSYRRPARMLIARATTAPDLMAIPVTMDLRGGRLPIPHRECDYDLPLNPMLVRGAYELDGEVLVIPDLDHVLS